MQKLIQTTNANSYSTKQKEKQSKTKPANESQPSKAVHYQSRPE